MFKRDSFTCQYCSAKPPKVPLEVDHILPVCKGGGNDIDNLITACFDCNRGKSGIELTSVPKTIIQKSEEKKIALKQYKDYKKMLDEEKQMLDNDVAEIESFYSDIFGNYQFTPKFRISVKMFLSKLGFFEVYDAMSIACNKKGLSHTYAVKYFCGVCWSKIREGN